MEFQNTESCKKILLNMNLGFDLDKVFIDYPPFVPDKLIDYLYKKKEDKTLVYRIPSRPEQLLRIFTHYSFFRPPIAKNVKFIKNLSKTKTNKYYLVSSRFSFLKKQTNDITNKYGLSKIFDQMFFNFENQQPHIFKNGVIKKIKIDRYVDYDLPLLKFIAEDNKNVKFFWLNKTIKKQLSKNIIAITNISEIL